MNGWNTGVLVVKVVPILNLQAQTLSKFFGFSCTNEEYCMNQYWQILFRRGTYSQVGWASWRTHFLCTLNWNWNHLANYLSLHSNFSIRLFMFPDERPPWTNNQHFTFVVETEEEEIIVPLCVSIQNFPIKCISAGPGHCMKPELSFYNLVSHGFSRVISTRIKQIHQVLFLHESLSGRIYKKDHLLVYKWNWKFCTCYTCFILIFFCFAS